MGSESALIAPAMIYVSNEDKPGFTGRFASLLGESGANIATFALGCNFKGGSAIALVEMNGPIPGNLLKAVEMVSKKRAARVHCPGRMPFNYAKIAQTVTIVHRPPR
jgi:D-3-phosphoglycerate dehydrogenase / 2-oxoglutarate reductase